MWTHVQFASLTKSWNGPLQLLPRVTSLILQATPHWKNKWTTHSPILLMVLVSNLRWSFYQKRLDQTSQWQCGTLSSPLELFAKSLWDPQVMKDFVCFVFPRGNILIVDHMCTVRLHQLTGSMKHSTIHQQLKVECSRSSLGVYLLVLDTLMILQILTIWWRTQSILSYKLY